MSHTPHPSGRVREVFGAFLLLGLTSFGGPIAHLSYFRTEFVERRRWLSEQAYADLVALCQFLPGPASSQVGFALGLMRGGAWGAAAAWTAFTLPSAIVLVLFALGTAVLEGPVSQGIIHGLKVTAVAIVAHAVWGMARSLCPDSRRAGIALAAVFTVVLVSGPLGQVAAIMIGALAGMVLCRTQDATQAHTLSLPVSARVGHLAALAFVLLLVGLPLLAWASPSATLAVMDAFYRAGALVFGGGHVLLPLLEAEVVQSGWVTPDDFLAGYGAAQAVPGPLFTFAAYLGAVMGPLGGSLLGAALALVMIFLPGLLLLVAVLPHWNRFRRWVGAQALMRGANAAVVGILGAALYHPVFTSAILGPHEFALALTGFLLLSVWKLPAWAVVIILAAGGIVITL
ncbi:chromate efflux transporter [Ectothiorhodospira shaposhnikovii]|uniref:chromate efflux transporter n=1 Tax=Ectothiorhodospira shaposhnikovii TaxID=1054 RepID=UPI001EE7CBF4|nr:chromate efflux transporter [Ectothiorhodospira shaposhnikovii]MCG5514479.1 chromate efflux transporter [Ectothiorhodospira shaposhnikovii]